VPRRDRTYDHLIKRIKDKTHQKERYLPDKQQLFHQLGETGLSAQDRIFFNEFDALPQLYMVKEERLGPAPSKQAKPSKVLATRPKHGPL